MIRYVNIDPDLEEEREEDWQFFKHLQVGKIMGFCTEGGVWLLVQRLSF